MNSSTAMDTKNILASALEDANIGQPSKKKIAKSLASRHVDVKLGTCDHVILVAGGVPKQYIDKLPVIVRSLLIENTLLLPSTIPLVGAQDMFACILRNFRIDTTKGAFINPRPDDAYAPRNIVQKVSLLKALTELKINDKAIAVEANIIASLERTVIDLHIVKVVRENLPKILPIVLKLVESLTRQDRERKLGSNNYNAIVAYAEQKDLYDLWDQQYAKRFPPLPKILRYEGNSTIFRDSESKALCRIIYEQKMLKEALEFKVRKEVRVEEKRLEDKVEKDRAALLKQALKKMEAKGTVTQEEADVLRHHFGRG